MARRHSTLISMDIISSPTPLPPLFFLSFFLPSFLPFFFPSFLPSFPQWICVISLLELTLYTRGYCGHVYDPFRGNCYENVRRFRSRKNQVGITFSAVHRGYVASSKDLWLSSNAVENASLLKRHQVSTTHYFRNDNHLRNVSFIVP